jgi:hypothetical protein
MSEYGWGALGWFSNVLAYGEEIIEYWILFFVTEIFI